MKTFKNKKGFTLIELLAVIVVLAIVMVLATTTVLPYMSNARQQAFTNEANAAIDAASRIMTLKTIGSITNEDLTSEDGKDYKELTEDNAYCFSLKKMAELGVFEKDIKDFGEDGYEGYVLVVTKNPTKAYSYIVKMHNDQLYIDNIAAKGGEAKLESVVDYSKSSQTGFDCTSASVPKN